MAKESADTAVEEQQEVVTDDDGEPTPTPARKTAREPTSEELAKTPEIKAAFENVFGKGSGTEGETTPTPAKGRQRAEETSDELEGVEGAEEADDGIGETGEEGAGADDKGTAEAEAEAARAKEKAGKEGEQAKADEGEAPTLSPVLIQAAKRAQWTDEEISEFVKANPQTAEKTFERILRSYNDLSAEYGRLGATRQPGEEAPPKETAARPAQQRPVELAEDDYIALLYGGKEKVDALREKYGEDMFNDLIRPMIAPVREMHVESQRQQTQAVANEISEFFSSLPKEFSALYGEGGQVSQDQFGNRGQLAQLADQIGGGAAGQGIRLSVGECLQRANLMFASEHLSELERKRITERVQKRSERLTQRPSKRAARTAAGGEPSDEAAAAAYTQHAAELGFDVAGGD